MLRLIQYALKGVSPSIKYQLVLPMPEARSNRSGAARSGGRTAYAAGAFLCLTILAFMPMSQHDTNAVLHRQLVLTLAYGIGSELRFAPFRRPWLSLVVPFFAFL